MKTLLRDGWRIALHAGAPFLAAIAVSTAMAQSDRPWIDPPERPAPNGHAASAPNPSTVEQKPSSPPTASQAPSTPKVEEAPSASGDTPDRKDAGVSPGPEHAAQRLASDYLRFWSASNEVTLATTPQFYAPRVEFHGELMSAEMIVNEKLRFVRRWPVRSYAPRPGTMETTCSPTGICAVRTVFDFRAFNPRRGRLSTGAATLELMISVAGHRPTIIAETSRIIQRGRVRAAGSLIDGSD